ncbi:fumarylacetoacetate hydrolase family protein [Maribacter sp. ACAM166]|uniref:fumarylacetoacetate hydrolase family protein n=1 Tax=Maribacter sp. ACAM166 TaxID=2508996 RepID=UPI0010FED740|nr:fumarylacetoacetate hydrolase family protein [Maribacter sp. ACAM166]TLP71113.1 fumarylacetoacetate hydrolase family protein [Maribacter sp. ACAM166]
MKLIRIGTIENEKPGVELPNGDWVDVSGFGMDYNEEFFGSDALEKLEKWVDNKVEKLPRFDKNSRIAAPMKRPSKIVCVGLNYAKHAKESGMTLPNEPVLFFKATSAIVGPNDDLIIPKGSTKTDWEVELGVVIGKKASYISKENAMDHVAGYVLHNDYSEREFQLERDGQWVKGKSCDTFAPIGPYIVTKDEIKDPHNLDLWLTVNGEIMQKSNTSDLVFDVPHLVSYISQYMTLLPGDIISTGTPFGVGLGLNPPKYLKPSDIVELGIEGLGTSKQAVKAL